MRLTIYLILMILGLLIVGAVNVYCDEPTGKRRIPWESPEYKKQIEIETAYKMFWGNHLRDPFYAPKGHRNEQGTPVNKRPVRGCNSYARTD